MMDDFYYNIAEAWLTRIYEHMMVVSDHYEKRISSQPWPLVRSPLLAKQFRDYVRFGFVRDVKGLDKLREQFIGITVRLHCNTVLCGHTPESPEAFLEEYIGDEQTINMEQFDEWLDSYLYDPVSQQLRISDFGMDKLETYASKLLDERKSPEEILQVINLMLMVVHQRSDLSAWYVRGGKDFLDELSGVTINRKVA